jgi:hypothetical protein
MPYDWTNAGSALPRRLYLPAPCNTDYGLRHAFRLSLPTASGVALALPHIEHSEPDYCDEIQRPPWHIPPAVMALPKPPKGFVVKHGASAQCFGLRAGVGARTPHDRDRAACIVAGGGDVPPEYCLPGATSLAPDRRRLLRLVRTYWHLGRIQKHNHLRQYSAKCLALPIVRGSRVQHRGFDKSLARQLPALVDDLPLAAPTASSL